jgi:hypothetical protein
LWRTARGRETPHRAVFARVALAEETPCGRAAWCRVWYVALREPAIAQHAVVAVRLTVAAACWVKLMHNRQVERSAR